MTWTTPTYQFIESFPVQWAELDVEIIGESPPDNAVLDSYQGGVPTGIRIALKRGDTIRLPLEVLPNILTLIGATQDNSKALIAINVDISTATVLRVYLVDESSGSGGGGTEDDYRVAGIVQINGVAVQRDIVIISDDPNGRAIVGEGESATDGTFDLTYNDWSGPVIVVALDGYGSEFPPSVPLNAGDVIHPSMPNGYVYVVTDSGTTGISEPVWSTTSSVMSGSVTFAPRAYYRPIASGPLQGELVE